MKKGAILLLPLITFAFFYFGSQKPFTSEVFARSGCCSHHQGVCGCGCCDGSPLSNTCAPYYPECTKPIYVDPTPRPTVRPSTRPSISPTIQPTTTSAENTSQPVNQPARVYNVTLKDAKQKSGGSEMLGLGVLGAMTYVGYKVWKGKKGR